jgi:hypothetical protein
MRDKRKVDHSSTLAIASSAKERDGGQKGQDVLWVGSGRWRRAFASECYAGARAWKKEAREARQAREKDSRGRIARCSRCARVWESETLAGDGNRRGGAGGRIGFGGGLASVAGRPARHSRAVVRSSLLLVQA